MKAVHTPKCFAGKPHFYEITGLFLSMHRHTGQGSAATADPVSSATVKRRSLLPLYCENLRNKTLRVLAFALGSGSALAIARWAGMTQNR
jgi:hypothetical protein